MKNYYTVKEASNILNVGIRTVQRYIHAGKLNATKLGREFRIDKCSLESIANIENDTKPMDIRALVKAGIELSVKNQKGLMATEAFELVRLTKEECESENDLIYNAIHNAYALGYMKAVGYVSQENK